VSADDVEAVWRNVESVRAVLPQCTPVRALHALHVSGQSVADALNHLVEAGAHDDEPDFDPRRAADSPAAVKALHLQLAAYFRAHRAVAGRTLRAVFAHQHNALTPKTFTVCSHSHSLFLTLSVDGLTCLLLLSLLRRC
jgi:hypothetical protein